jgi:hypothetical protein
MLMRKVENELSLSDTLATSEEEEEKATLPWILFPEDSKQMRLLIALLDVSHESTRICTGKISFNVVISFS